jgi:tripartite-type tricarboxylate transporter receptor subunit TctC
MHRPTFHAPDGAVGEACPTRRRLRLHREIGAAMSAPELVRQMADAGIEVRLSSSQEFAALIRADMTKWAAVVKRADVRLD